MSGLGDNFRERAEKQNATAAELFGSREHDTDRKVQGSAIIAKVTANMLLLLGEVVDYLRLSVEVDDATTRRRAQSERLDAIRKAAAAAAATGDYTNYDRLVAEFGRTIGSQPGSGEGGTGE
ncbi:MAG: hypothetical protein V3V96_10645 [Acidiferrobacterales bacterium]